MTKAGQEHGLESEMTENGNGLKRRNAHAGNFDESSLSMEILIWAISRWLKTVIRPTSNVTWGHWKPVSIQFKVDFRCRKFEFCDLGYNYEITRYSSIVKY